MYDTQYSTRVLEISVSYLIKRQELNPSLITKVFNVEVFDPDNMLRFASVYCAEHDSNSHYMCVIALSRSHHTTWRTCLPRFSSRVPLIDRRKATVARSGRVKGICIESETRETKRGDMQLM